MFATKNQIYIYKHVYILTSMFVYIVNIEVMGLNLYSKLHVWFLHEWWQNQEYTLHEFIFFFFMAHEFIFVSLIRSILNGPI